MELIDARKDSFYCVAYSYTRNREDALDVVSESVCKAYTHLHRLEDVDAFYPQCPTPVSYTHLWMQLSFVCQ